MSQSERNVVLADVTDEQAGKALTDQSAIGNVKDAVPVYTYVPDFTTFVAKYTMIDDNFVVHFFPTEQMMEYVERPDPAADDVAGANAIKALANTCITQWTPKMQNYWTNIFPKTLDHVARLSFEATAPRLQAKYTAELRSWWLKAQGYGHIIDKDKFIERFLEELDRELDKQSL